MLETCREIRLVLGNMLVLGAIAPAAHRESGWLAADIASPSIAVVAAKTSHLGE